MIYTVTFNPAIDYVVQLEHLTQGTVNRTGDEAVYCGGKGINVSTVLTKMWRWAFWRASQAMPLKTRCKEKGCARILSVCKTG